MEWFESWAITLAVFLPVLGAVVVTVVPRGRDRLIRALGLVFTAAALLVGIVMLFGYDFSAPGAFGDGGAAEALQYEVNLSWISVIDVNYHIGIDGVSLPLLELTLLLGFLCMVYTWRWLPEPGRLLGAGSGDRGNRRGRRDLSLGRGGLRRLRRRLGTFLQLGRGKDRVGPVL